MSRVIRAAGIFRSLVIYYGNPFRARRMECFYGQFIKKDDLCFDIGSHVGSRIRVWASLGARVVAVEPQLICVKILRILYGCNSRIEIISKAVGAEQGKQMMRICEGSPTLTTLSSTWIDTVKKVEIFRGIHWNEGPYVPVTSLAKLIEEFGVPAFTACQN